MKAKLIMFAGFAILVGLSAMSNIFGGDIVITNERVATSTVEVTVDALEERIKAAKEAAKNDIITAAQNAYDAVYEEKMLEVEDNIKKEYILEIESTISSESY